ncbi:MAG: 30S ribosomal protein S20 [Candidatus Buchananbacteria bacterium RIFCSPLOWO2_01_FULL_46_12]|uniref:Small ribosomal subunit protein bS20 n=2 Tax=Candidatus Buchananiibacteriota TaxID=1817903 RepID=A0A1G1YQS2_9BACT|nr:MAG: 30S ribosomal protein S20 [Candidatus Buchananbacteria bacterium RIFCSPHIGHO2_01_FULL_44_11]OGY54156.1 MAG: 30S ribosomal protein S20 [Candidatus Buchananbacteria bacterium RIFCSPLOWO2_01_FULL_46_12]
MPIQKAGFKALRQNHKIAFRNRKAKSDIAALIRRVKKMVVVGDQAKTSDWLRQAVKKIDKAVQKNILKKNTANRTKSRLFKAVNALTKKS